MTFRLIFEPADTLAISDGRPFNQNDAGRAKAASVFPPPPDTIYGAARVACAFALGYPGIPWPAEQLGSYGNAGRFAVSGPFFQYADDNCEPEDLLPIPAHAVVSLTDDPKQNITAPVDLLRPSVGQFESDLGLIPLLEPLDRKKSVVVESLAGRWGRKEAVRKLLSGIKVTAAEIGWTGASSWNNHRTRLWPNSKLKVPGWSVDDIASIETRIGIARDFETRHVEEGQLYSSVRRRLQPGVSMYAIVHGVTIGVEKFSGSVPLGGEARFAFVHAMAHEEVEDNSATESEQYLIYLTTPAVIDPPIPEQTIDDFPGMHVMSAITGIGLRAGRSRESGQPQNTERFHILPAGSVLFMQGKPHCFPGKIGSLSHLGYGNYLTGAWNNG